MILTAAECKRLVETSLEDDDLQWLLDAAEQAIVDRYGPAGATYTETLDGGGTYLFLRRRADSITSLVETVSGTDTTLEVDDYRMRQDGISVLRLDTGTNKRGCWGAPITATYVPRDDEAERVRVQSELVKAMLTYAPGVSLETDGAWTTQFASNSAWNNSLERESILASMVGGDGVGAGFA